MVIILTYINNYLNNIIPDTHDLIYHNKYQSQRNDVELYRRIQIRAISDENYQRSQINLYKFFLGI